MFSYFLPSIHIVFIFADIREFILVGFFRISGIFQWFFILLWAFFLRLPYIFRLLPSTVHITAGNNQGPFSEVLFSAVSYSNLPENLLSFIGAFFLILIQASLIQNIFSKNQIFSEHKSLPDILYVCMASLLPDFYFLSPESVGGIFLTAVIGIVWKYMHTAANDNDAFKVGFFSGIAALFYIPYALFTLCGALCIVLFARTSPRHYLLIVWGFLFSVFLCALFLYASDGMAGLERGFGILKQLRLSVSDFGPAAQAFLAIVTVLGFLLFPGLSGARSTMPSKYYLFQNVSLFWFLFTLAVWYFMGETNQSRLTAAVPCTVLWSTAAVSLQRRKAVREILLLSLLVLPLIVGYFLS